ncbi:MAG: site-specific integrase [Deltaproteobacteria bacterium]|nr:site-specific integrase [Deltaproteobacteria bacterium]
MNKVFESFMAPQFNQFAAYRKQLGYKPDGIRSVLLDFDRYLQKRAVPDLTHLTPAFFLKLRASIHEDPNTVNRVLSGLRALFAFLVRQGLYTQNPLDDIPARGQRYFVPYIFTMSQTDQLLQAVCQTIRHQPRYFLFDVALYLSILLMARCGMRINEPLRLQRDHYRPDEGTVYIEKTKFRKHRLIPLPKTVQKELDDYLRLRQLFGADNQSPYLLASKRQRGFHENQVRYIFHRAVEAIGIREQRQIIGDMTFGKPVPHSLRHSFAINTLTQIKARGQNPQHALPVLAAYMGHRKYQYTGAYLKVNHARDRRGLIEFAKSQLDVI